MSENVQVMVRFRPCNGREEAQAGSDKVFEFAGDEVQHFERAGAAARRFTYDKIFEPDSDQEQLYEAIGRPTVESVLKGYNGSVLAYGQTGSGKTYSMMGPDGGDPSCLDPAGSKYESRGLIPRIVDRLFTQLQKLDEEEVEWAVTAQAFELYKESLRDLTVGPGEQKEYRIREDVLSGRGVYIESMQERPCRDAASVLKLIADAARCRHTAATGANDTSSRSHSITVISVRQVNHILQNKTHAHIHLVDLAGSEKVGKTGAQGERLKEAQMINLSLTLLGNVIYKLTDGRSLHIPYRDSKLTRILQDSFGGNSRTTLLCNCSPHSYNSPETLSTLQFASRAKMIRNKPVCGKELSQEELRLAYKRALEEIRELKDRVALLEGSGGGGRQQRHDDQPVRGGCGHESVLEDLRCKLRDGQDALREAKDMLFESRSEGEAQAKEIEWYRGRVAALEQSEKAAKEKLRKEQSCSALWAKRFHDRSNKELQLQQQLQQATRRPSEPRKSSGRLAQGHAGKAMRKGSKGDVTSAAEQKAADKDPIPEGPPTPPSEADGAPPSEPDAALPPDPALLERIEALEAEVGRERRRCAAAETLYAESVGGRAQLSAEVDRRGDRIDELERLRQLDATKLSNSERENKAARDELLALQQQIERASLTHDEKERMLGRRIQEGEDALCRLREEHSELGQLAMRLRDAAAQREYCELAAIELAVKAEDLAAAENDAQMLDAWTVDGDVKAALSASALGTLGDIVRHFDMIRATLAKEPFTAQETEAQRLTLLAQISSVLDRANTTTARIHSML